MGVGVDAGAFPEDLAVPLESEGLEGAQDGGGSTWNFPRAVEIFHTHQPLAAGRPGVEIVAEAATSEPKCRGPVGEGANRPRYVLVPRFTLFCGYESTGTPGSLTLTDP